jgi:hypothetical protein
MVHKISGLLPLILAAQGIAMKNALSRQDQGVQNWKDQEDQRVIRARNTHPGRKRNLTRRLMCSGDQTSGKPR